MSKHSEQQFKEQGGAATMDPSRFRRWLTSKMMTRMSSGQSQIRLRSKAEKKRQKADLPHRIDYFHQVDDGYSHLAVQLLEQLQARYDVDLHCHLVSESHGANLPEPGLLSKLSCYDAQQISSYYGLEAPVLDSSQSPDFVGLAESILAKLSNQDFITNAASISSALWRNDEQALHQLSERFGHANEQQTQSVIQAGNDYRSEMKHYSGAMFHYAGEWYWGVDRLYHLENRLRDLKLDKEPNQALLADRKELITEPLNASNSAKEAGQLTLVIYASLRSPYTAIAFDRTVEFANTTGVKLEVRPVLPMVMRGVPATMEKGKYILFDTGREARAIDVPFGPCADPIGEPTRRAYSLYSWAEQQGKSIEFFSAFLRCAWVEAINTNTDKGMQTVVESAGLDWAEAQTVIDTPGWETRIEANRLAMYQLGLWGVPSYQLLDENNNTLLALWGQDRLWLVSELIQEQLKRFTNK